ncbi:hypothetical protein AAF712_006541 [Marasmius tenuissimus]|uniref:S-adenosyl-L-methionine-dependent methyltransferase n=1 Tax=Marasmius tenuissimus TaxID=585030 RepID=A0ABR3A0F8_9AGAR
MSDQSLYNANVAHWDQFSKDLDLQPWGIVGMNIWKKLLPHVLKAAPFNKNTSEVMDFGCGNGFNASLLVPHAKTILGIDVSSGMVDEFNKNVKKWGIAEDGNISAIHVDLTEGGLDGRKFDIIFSSMVYHHLPSPEETTKLLASYLKPGGRLLVTDWIKGEHETYTEQIGSIMKVGGFSEEEMKSIFESSGLKFLGFEGAAKMDEMVGDYHLDKTAYLAWGTKL